MPRLPALRRPSSPSRACRKRAASVRNAPSTQARHAQDERDRGHSKQREASSRNEPQRVGFPCRALPKKCGYGTVTETLSYTSAALTWESGEAAIRFLSRTTANHFTAANFGNRKARNAKLLLPSALQGACLVKRSACRRRGRGVYAAAPPRMLCWTSPPWPAPRGPPPAPRPPRPPVAVVEAVISVVEPPLTVPSSA